MYWTHPAGDSGAVHAAIASGKACRPPTSWPAHLALAGALLALALGAALPAAWRAWDDRTRTTNPRVPPLDIYATAVDDGPVTITVTAAWERVPHVTTRDALRRDPVLWRRMRVVDWDAVPDGLREQGLEAMLARYRRALFTPAQWDHMTAHDWDTVPQPIRALAFRHMLQYWVGYYHVGRRYGLSSAAVADTAAAIVMSESWFEHRAEHVNAFGNRDLGLGQASDSARATMVSLYAEGFADVLIEEDEYFNPWPATRFVALWLGHLLNDVNGDLDLATRAYHRGLASARRGEGEEYLQGVLRRRSVYIRDRGVSPAWHFLWQRDRDLTRTSWPWLASRHVPGRRQGSSTMAWDRPLDQSPSWWRLALTPPPDLRSRSTR